jgi:hypothetical protein
MEENIDITLYFVSGFLFLISCDLNLFPNYCKSCVIANMDFGRHFVWVYYLIFVVG